MLLKRATGWFIVAAFVCQPVVFIEQAASFEIPALPEGVEEALDCLSECRLGLKSCHKSAEKAFKNGGIDESGLEATLLSCGEEYRSCVGECEEEPAI